MFDSVPFLLILMQCNAAYVFHEKDHGDWNHHQQGRDWKGKCRSGKQQSPVDLSMDFLGDNPPKMHFVGYDHGFLRPLTLFNKGYTASLTIGRTTDGKLPYVYGGPLKAKYMAEELHFHWGAKRARGSEHTIHKNRFRMEMHIVHRREDFKNIDAAVGHRDGLAVLGILINVKRKIRPGRKILKILFDNLKNIQKYHQKTKVSKNLSLQRVVNLLQKDKYFSYRGSLTTPTCEEGVLWIVFQYAIDITKSQASKLFNLKDAKDKEIKNNYRALQPKNGRPVLFFEHDLINT